MWREWSKKLVNKGIILGKFIEGWKKGVGKFLFEKFFFMDVRFILNEEMEYEGFEFELKDGILRFFGREWDMFMFIFEFEGDEEIFEYVYFLMFEFFELR